MPSVEKLTLEPDCRLDHFHAALEAGMVTVTELIAFIDWGGQIDQSHVDYGSPEFAASIGRGR